MSTNATYLIAIVVAGLIVLLLLIQYLDQWKKKRQLARDYESKEQVFDNQLARYNPYYRSLEAQGRDRFMRRVLAFMESKNFEYIDMEAEDIIPLLISSAAIQLTFGLEHYLLDYFRNIYILKDNYRYGLYKTPFEGHVSEDGIYLSWGNFFREFGDYSDGQNVGLHEMAHALVYVNFTAGEGRDDAFHDRFTAFSAIGRPVFERMQAGENNLLGNYAATNYQEFWAVCVETFFERPVTFKKQLLELYQALCDLLNQDPLTPAKVRSQPPID
jgi:Mlc titration factor MtfA (ptsG expression regulator)